MNKTNRKIFDLTGLTKFKLPIVGEEIRHGDTLVVGEIKDLNMTLKQLIEYLLLLDSEKIEFMSMKETDFDSLSEDGARLIQSLRTLYKAGKYTLSNNSSNIEGSGRKKDSFDKDTELAVLAMYKVNSNVSAIATALNIGSRDTVYRHLKRNNLK